MRENAMKRSKPLTIEERIERLETKLNQDIFLTGEDRKFLSETLDINRSSGSIKEGKINQGTQTSLNKSSSRNGAHCDENEIFWFYEHKDLDQEQLEEILEKFENELKTLPSSETRRIKILMDRTFIKRRSLILKSPEICKIRKLYPALFSLDEIKNELARILHLQVYQEFKRNIKAYCRFIVKLGNKFQEVEVEKYMEKASSKEDKKIIYQLGSILLLPYLLNVKKNFILYSDQQDQLSEYLHIIAPSKHDVFTNKPTMKVVIENSVVCKNLTFIDSVFVMMACFFIFNICYPEVFNKTLVAIERLYLEEKETDAPHDVSTFVENLQNMVKSA